MAKVVFVRKRLVEIQYLRTTITDEQRSEFGQLIEDTIRRIEAAQFLPHSGVRFPQSSCTTCPSALGKPGLVVSTQFAHHVHTTWTQPTATHANISVVSASDTSPSAQAVQLRVQQAMTGEQRLLLALETSAFTRELAKARIWLEHPEWSDREIARECLRRAFLPACLR